MPRSETEIETPQALDRAAHIQGDWTGDPQYRCEGCGRRAAPWRLLLLSARGWLCPTCKKAEKTC